MVKAKRHLNFPKRLFLTAITTVFVSALIAADETVTIPKSRLQELERKEAELDKLKGELHKTKGENVELKKQHEDDAAKTAELKKQHQEDAAKIANTAAAPPESTHVSPPMSSLPPLKEGESVNALDLANHYRADAAAAGQRYGKHRFKLEGEIVGFSKPPFVRPYHLYLKAADREIRIVCGVTPPERYSVVYTAENATKLIGTVAGNKQVMAKIGDTAVVQGRCEGLKGLVIEMSGCELKSVTSASSSSR